MSKWLAKLALTSVFATGIVVAAEQKIAVVDVQKAMRAANEVKVIEAQLKKEFSAEEKKIGELKKQIEGLKEQQQRNWAVMGDAEKQKLQEEGLQVTNELKALSQDSQRRLAARQQELLQPVILQAQEAIKEVMKEGGYNMVFRRAALVEFDPKHDITLKVTLNLNEKSE